MEDISAKLSKELVIVFEEIKSEFSEPVNHPRQSGRALQASRADNLKRPIASQSSARPFQHIIRYIRTRLKHLV